MKMSFLEWLSAAAGCALLVMTFVRYPVATSGFVGAVVMWVVLRRLRQRRRLTTRGWVVRRSGRDDVLYLERVGGEVRSLTINGELGTPHIVYVPTDEEWTRSAPDWARARKLEILGRIKAELGTMRYEFIGDGTDP